MESNLFMQPKSFDGILSRGADKTAVTFSVQVDIAGEATISLDRFPRNSSNKFISDAFHSIGTAFENFSLRGGSSDGAIFECEDVIFTSLGNLFDLDRTLCPTAHYSLAKIDMPMQSAKLPVLSWRLKGFRSFFPLSVETDLGFVEMVGARDADGKDEMSGSIRVAAASTPNDVQSWRRSASDLCDHIRHVMSFAANVDLCCPVVEFSNQGRIAIELFSSHEQQMSVWPPFQWLHLQDIFSCAVRSHFQRSLCVKNLPFAIKWFNVRGSYEDANLITSMTVLESLIDSNLSERDCLLLGNKSFKTLRKGLREVVKQEAQKWTVDVDQQKKFVDDLNSRFADLQRRSLYEKMQILARRWGVRLDDIAVERIRAAKSARDQVVHQGHYVPKNSADDELHTHVLTVRELVVRFILAAIGFSGRYQSFVGGQHLRELATDAPMPDYNAPGAP